jgi:hypothetical protein
MYKTWWDEARHLQTWATTGSIRSFHRFSLSDLVNLCDVLIPVHFLPLNYLQLCMEANDEMGWEIWTECVFFCIHIPMASVKLQHDRADSVREIQPASTMLACSLLSLQTSWDSTVLNPLASCYLLFLICKLFLKRSLLSSGWIIITHVQFWNEGRGGVVHEWMISWDQTGFRLTACSDCFVVCRACCSFSPFV